MSEKANAFKFTIQMNAQDKLHQTAADYLNRQGRRKGQYIVNAILRYEQEGGQLESAHLPLDATMIEMIIRKVLATQPKNIEADKKEYRPESIKETDNRNEALGRSEVAIHISPESETATADNEISPDAMRSIMDGLNAFQQS